MVGLTLCLLVSFSSFGFFVSGGVPRNTYRTIGVRPPAGNVPEGQLLGRMMV